MKLVFAVPKLHSTQQSRKRKKESGQHSVPTDEHNHFQSLVQQSQTQDQQEPGDPGTPLSSWLPQLEELAHHKLQIYLQTPLLADIQATIMLAEGEGCRKRKLEAVACCS